MRVLFLCTGNSARSQMAEALLRHMTHGRAEVFSAGTEPKADIHPLAKAVLEEKFRIDTVALRPKHLRQFEDERFDYVITVCDRAAESCPVFPGDPEQIHWSFPDPALLEPSAQRPAFEKIASELTGRMRIWMALPKVRNQLDATDL
jgi:protein-tyrosine-phosphatase